MQLDLQAGPVKVLIVDDHPENLFALEELLADLEATMVRASSGAEALKCLLQDEFAVILLDVQMPELDGFETARLIRDREKTRTTPIVFLSATSFTPEHLARGYALGAVDYLSKPLAPEALRAKVAALVDLAQRSQQLEARIVEHRRAEAALRGSETRLAAIVASAKDSIITVNEEQKILVFNASAEQMFRCSAAEALGGSIDRFIPERFRAVYAEYLRRLGETGVASRSMGVPGTLTVLRADGTEFEIEATISQVETGGEKFLTAIIRDVTERTRAEEALRDSEARTRSVVDHVVDGIITIDEHAIVQTFNPAAEGIFGFQASEIIGRNVKVLMPAPYRDEHDTYVANYLKTGEARIIGSGREVVGRRKDGSTFPMDLAVSEFSLGGGRFFTGIVRDITERKRLEEQLFQRAEELADADRRKDQFLAMLAHELRNPLAPVLNALAVLEVRGSGTPEVQRLRGVIDRQTRQLARLVDDLLDVGRITTGKIELRKETVELGEVLERAVEMVLPLLEGGQRRLELTVPDQEVFLHADPARLQQVISNLLHNAAKYTPLGGNIWLTAERAEDTVTVSVRDDGVGISPDLLPHVFDLFVQADRSLARTQGGLGIGLTMVRSLTELHGGTISVRSEGPGKGSEFVLTLPVAAHVGAGEARASDAGAGAASPGGAATRRRILVVDDNVDAAETVAELLSLWGHDYRTAFDGEQALEVASEYDPDVILLDIGLPRMDGFEVARQLRQEERRAQTLLVALTGYGQEEDRRRSRQVGFDHHLTKPVDPQTLREVISR